MEAFSKIKKETLLLIGAIACALAFWSLRFFSGLTIDEAGTAWGISGPFKEIIERCVVIQSQAPIYYGLLWIWSSIFGTSELALRLPSVIAAACSCVLVFHIGKCEFSTVAGLIAALVFSTSDGVVEAATTARPYALAILGSLLVFAYFLQWRRSPKWRYCIILYVLYAVTVYTHYLFSLIILILTAYSILVPIRGSQPHRRQTAAFVVGLVPFFASLFYFYYLTAPGSNPLKYLEIPDLSDAVSALFHPQLFILLTISIYLFLVQKKSLACLAQHDLKGILFPLVIFCAPPVALFLISRCSASSFFLPRYYVYHLAGAALLCGILADSLVTRRRSLTVLVFGLYALAAFTELNCGARGREGWREGARELQKGITSEVCPVFLYSGYVESRQMSFLLEAEKRSFLATPLTYYAPSEAPLLLPLSLETPGSVSYLQDIYKEAKQRSDCSYLYFRTDYLGTHSTPYTPTTVLLQDKLQQDGYNLVSSRSFHRVILQQYKRDLKITRQPPPPGQLRLSAQKSSFP